MPVAPPLSQPDDLGDTCNATTAGDCMGNFCECTHVLHIPLGAVAELFFIDQGQLMQENNVHFGVVYVQYIVA